MSLSPEQLELRRSGLGGSETAALFGLDRFKRPYDIYLGKITGWVADPTEDMMRGQFFEEPAAQWYAWKHKVEVVNPDKTFRHAKRNIILATPDRLLNLPNGETELLSIKNPRAFDNWGEDETGDIPLSANIQVQQEAAVLASHGYNIARAWVAAPVWGELRRYPVRLDVELQERIMSGAERWWAKHIEPKVPPALDGGEGARRWLLSKYPHADGKEKVEATLEQESLCAALRETEAALEAAQETYDTAKARIIGSMGAAYGLKGNFGSITNFDTKYGKRTFRARWKKG